MIISIFFPCAWNSDVETCTVSQLGLSSLVGSPALCCTELPYPTERHAKRPSLELKPHRFEPLLLALPPHFEDLLHHELVTLVGLGVRVVHVLPQLANTSVPRNQQVTVTNRA
jgi:hypothetical protein